MRPMHFAKLHWLIMTFTRILAVKEKTLVLQYRKNCGFLQTNREDLSNKSILSSKDTTNEKRELINQWKNKYKKGQSRKVNQRCVRKLIRCPKNSRNSSPKVTVKTLIKDSRLSLEMASRTFSRGLNEKGCGFYQVRQKKLVNSEKDKNLRMICARKMKH